MGYVVPCIVCPRFTDSNYEEVNIHIISMIGIPTQYNLYYSGMYNNQPAIHSFPEVEAEECKRNINVQNTEMYVG